MGTSAVSRRRPSPAARHEEAEAPPAAGDGVCVGGGAKPRLEMKAQAECWDAVTGKGGGSLRGVPRLVGEAWFWTVWS